MVWVLTARILCTAPWCRQVYKTVWCCQGKLNVSSRMPGTVRSPLGNAYTHCFARCKHIFHAHCYFSQTGLAQTCPAGCPAWTTVMEAIPFESQGEDCPSYLFSDHSLFIRASPSRYIFWFYCGQSPASEQYPRQPWWFIHLERYWRWVGFLR